MNALKLANPFVNISTAKVPIIWSFGGGKGGVGKSLITSSLGFTMAKAGHKVLVVDLDLGGANLHTCLGAAAPQLTLSDFIAGRCPDLNDLVTIAPYYNLHFISGAFDSLEVANIPEHQILKIIDALKKLPYDYVLLDLGAGTSNATLDFFLCADRRILTVTPEPTSIENTYRFLKSAYYRRLIRVESHFGAPSLVAQVLDQKNSLGVRSPADLISYLQSTHDVRSEALISAVHSLSVEIVVNQIRTQSDAQLGDSVASVCKKYFDIPAQSLGALSFDNNVWQTLRRRKPFLIEAPFSPLVRQFQKIAKELVDRER
ncbi:MAG: ATP-binding protein [Bdellovibrionales bacterium CG10_big_fil_rev_8_21_14_0_10_45_34]|nr:MAG: ATP-binding protein [Bdellovibrionales bacterium CG10_big_fil_rev_8_21_14_0_10_45_34]